MSKTKTKKTVNKFTNQLDKSLKLLKRERTRLDGLAKRDNKDSIQYRGALQSVQNLENKVNDLYGIVSGQQEYIKFSRVGGWSNPLNKLGIGPHSNAPVFNTFALTETELEQRYPTLHSPKKKVNKSSSGYKGLLINEGVSDPSANVEPQQLTIGGNNANKPIGEKPSLKIPYTELKRVGER